MADAASEDLAAYTTAAPVAGRSVGHTSVVFKLKLEGGLVAAYKPRSRRGGGRYKGEIAAYRLAQALGLPNVPPAIYRTFDLAVLRAALGTTDAGDLLTREAVARADGQLPGAVIPWIDKLEFTALEGEPARSEWRAWLGTAPVPEEQKRLAGQISTMIVFDYVTGNWDRWSGGNIGIDRQSGTLLFIDNDGAFFDPPPPKPLAAQLALLMGVARFSRSLVLALRAFEPTAAALAMGDEAQGVPLLSARVLAGMEERRKKALAIIDAKIAGDGEARVLCFE